MTIFLSYNQNQKGTLDSKCLCHGTHTYVYFSMFNVVSPIGKTMVEVMIYCQTVHNQSIQSDFDIYVACESEMMSIIIIFQSATEWFGVGKCVRECEASYSKRGDKNEARICSALPKEHPKKKMKMKRKKIV